MLLMQKAGVGIFTGTIQVKFHGNWAHIGADYWVCCIYLILILSTHKL